MSFRLSYPERTKWEDRDTLPDPHPWRLPNNNSFGFKESAVFLFVFFLAVSVYALYRFFPQKKRIITIGLTILLVFLILFPLTSMSIINTILTPITRTPPLHLDKNVYFTGAKTIEHPVVYENIRRETDHILEHPEKIPYADSATKLVDNSYIASDKSGDTGWRVFNIKTAGKISPKARELMPYTCSVVENMPDAVNVVISILQGKHCIPIHQGYYKGFLRYHLGVIVPEPDKTVLHVNGQKYHWKEGEGVIFDDMFPHEVYNASSESRAVLYIDVVRKYPNYPLVTKANNQFCQYLAKSPAVHWIQKLDEKQQ